MIDYEHLLEHHTRTDEERRVLAALAARNSQRKAAAYLGLTRDKLRDTYRRVVRRAEANPVPEVRGSVGARRPVRPPSRQGRIQRYVLTCAQNNTHLHAQFWQNLLALCGHYGAQLLVSTISYDKNSYGAKATKRGRGPTAQDAGLWWAPELAPFLSDGAQVELAPDLLWCSEMNISPSAVNPLSGLETYGAGRSTVFPHTTIVAKGLPVLSAPNPRFAYTTGAVTQRNYIAKKAGIKAEFHHQYGALLVEVDTETNDWWARQINARENGSFYDLDRRVADGVVERGHRPEAINWGDLHASEVDDDVRELNWSSGGILDQLKPRHQFFHDTLSFRSRSHHKKAFNETYRDWLTGGAHEGVEAEAQLTAEVLSEAVRPWCKTVAVNSNHDRHFDRWLDEADYRKDLANAELYLEASLARVKAWGRGDTWNGLQWLMWRYTDDAFQVKFLDKDESFVICPEHPVQCGQHGDAGTNGSRGTTASYARLTERINKGHAHTAELKHGVASAGVCMRTASYCHGASSWSITHVLTYANGKRCLLTQRGGRLWAPTEEELKR